MGTSGNLTCDRGFVYRLPIKSWVASSVAASASYKYLSVAPIRCFATAKRFGDERGYEWRETTANTRLTGCVPG